MKYEKIICYHHNDMDGIGSAAIVHQLFPNAVLIEMNYGENDNWNKHDVKDAMVIVVDFSFKNMEKLKEACGLLCWCDHHISAMKNNQELWNSDKIDGLRSIYKSGIGLTWKWFHPEEKMPKIVKTIQDADLYKFEFADTKAIYQYLNVMICEPENFNWKWLLKTDIQINLKEIDTWRISGEILLEAGRARVKKSFKAGRDFKFRGHKARLMNTNHDYSGCGNLAVSEHGYDIGLVYSFRGNNVVFGIYTIEERKIDVSKIAQKYGGGGHACASGFQITLDEFVNIFTEK